MADHIWTVICQQYITDADSNALTLVNVLDELTLLQPGDSSDELPNTIQYKFALVTLWCRSNFSESEQISARTQIRGSKGKVLGGTEYAVDLREHVRRRIRTNFDGIPFDGFGRYRFVVQKKTGSGRWRQVTSVPLDIKHAVGGSEKSV